MNEIRNAKITATEITMADYGCLTFRVCVEGSGWGCWIGGYCIGKGYLDAKEFEGYDRGLEAIMRVMDTVGVNRWEDLKGKYIRVETNGCGGTVHKIGHIMRDKWFDLKEFFADEGC